MHENELPFINGGHHVSWAPDIPIWLSLTIILGTLLVTTVASLVGSARMDAEKRDEMTGPRRDWDDA
jgi:tellurite resistance protein TerC